MNSYNLSLSNPKKNNLLNKQFVSLYTMEKKWEIKLTNQFQSIYYGSAVKS